MLLQQKMTIAASASYSTGENSERLDEALTAVRMDLRSGHTYSIGHYAKQYPECAEVLHQVIPSIAALEQVRAQTMGDAHVSRAPGRIGDYEICGELGRGGMAVVYEARDTKLNRRVALKVLPFSSGQQPISVLRFQHEAQVLAQLDHPYIVPVFDVGEHEGSRFLAMKLIEGVPLDDLIAIEDPDGEDSGADELGSGIRGSGAIPTEDTPTVIAGDAAAVAVPADVRRTARRETHRAAVEQIIPGGREDARRFLTARCVDVARALHAAHECGVVHRDIKPSNLLLDSSGHVWITDFGLALTRETDKLTRTGDLLGTVRYMSPEQARGNRTSMDARTDVYSLGITLYELTTGCAAFSGEPCRILQRIESEGLTPPRRRDPEFPRDLQNIILKAVARSPDQRYETAAELADDLQRFLDGEPVVACAPTLMERTAAWISRRRRAVAAMLGLAAVTLVSSLVATFLVWNEVARTSSALALAEANFRETQSVVDRFGLQLDSELALIEGTEHLRRQVLSEVIAHYRSFIVRAKQSGELTENLALTLNKVAKLTERVGTPEEALSAHVEAWRAFDALVTRDPGNREWRVHLALCDNNIALLYAGSGNFAAAEERYAAAQTALRSLVRDTPSHRAAQRALGRTWNNIGLMHVERHAPEQAVRFFRDAQELLMAILSTDPSDELTQRYLAASYENLAAAHRRESPHVAREAHLEAIRLQQTLLAAHPERRDYRQELAISYDSLGVLLSDVQEQAEAAAAFASAATIQRELLRTSPGSPIVLRQLAWSSNRLGQALARQGQVQDAITALRNALDAQQRACDVTDRHPRDVWTLGGIWNNLGFACEGAGVLPAAADAYRIAVETLEGCADEASASGYEQRTLHRARLNLARIQKRLCDHQEARGALTLDRQL